MTTTEVRATVRRLPLHPLDSTGEPWYAIVYITGNESGHNTFDITFRATQAEAMQTAVEVHARECRRLMDEVHAERLSRRAAAIERAATELDRVTDALKANVARTLDPLPAQRHAWFAQRMEATL